ncbi:MAG: adenylate/guanylate cyclase domain-containing protein [Pseudomonadales bacterium]|nr:adenylate/guanylate cyclase domain-containing protein [Pseudomonadales bacterium]
MDFESIEADRMAEQKTRMLGIMFADVAGSTRLYEAVGDIDAESQISAVLARMSQKCIDRGGSIVKNIGDEILVAFSCADSALQAACDIQLETRARNEGEAKALLVRIGLHFGPVIVKSNDVFGDTVNVAARMAGIAQATQIICTQEMILAMEDSNSIESRQLDSLYVKGKEKMIDIVEVLWAPDDSELTCLFSAKKVLESKAAWFLDLRYQNGLIKVSKELPSIVMGRGKQCELLIHSPQASRAHAKLISRRGKVMLSDQSTNGTFVKSLRGEEVFVHLEEFPLSESGSISLGLPVSQNKEHLIHFNYS